MIADAFLLLAFNAALLCAGVGVTRVLAWPTTTGSLGLAYLAGAAAYGVAAQLLYVLGAPLQLWQVVGTCAVLAALGLVPRVRRALPAWPRPASRLELVLACAACALLVAVAIDLWFQPLWAYDSWTFWTPKARALVRLDGLDAGWFTQSDLLNRDYPLLLPAVEAGGFRFTGIETRLLDLQSWLFLVAFAAAFLHLVAGRASRVVTWTVLAMVAFAPTLAAQLAYAEADVPLAAFFACAGLLALLWLEERDSRTLALAALLAAATVATKAEGLIFVVALFAALAVLSRRLEPALAGVAALAAGLLPWRIWMHAHDVENQSSFGRVVDVSFMAQHASRFPHAIAYVLARMLDPTAWLLLVPLGALAFVLALREGQRAAPLFVGSTIVLSLAGLVLAYWTTPLDFDYHLATSARRVISGLVLFLAAATPLLASRAAADP